MPTLLLARLRQDLTYLHSLGENADAITERERGALQAFLTIVLADLYQLYPAQVPVGRRYQFLQHLSALDIALEAFIATPNYLHLSRNRHYLRREAIIALTYALHPEEPPA